MTTSAQLDVRDLTVSYDGVPALRGVTFSCGPGEVCGIVGPNGAGKSTLVKAILGLLVPDSGSITVGGRPVDDVRRSIAYLPQRSEIDWDYPAVVEEVVTMGRYPHLGLGRRPGARDRRLVRAALERVGLQDFARRQIGELSGGQQQRVFLASALAQEASMLLLDEPFAGIDALTEQLLQRQVHALRDAGATIVVVNHDLATVGRLYDRLLVLSRRVVAFGPVAETFTAATIAEAYGGVPDAAAVQVSAARLSGGDVP